ncbi:RIO-type serine/threonine-protein kinase Rio1 [uncultured archaeon]|nr:RIO-type serine/threonine-protein kinase Rio1 [uncultured archaeon]
MAEEGKSSASGKKKDKSVRQLKQREKVEAEVFDKPTLISISKIMKKGIIANLDYPVSTGKEANIFKATAPSGASLAVKIYKITTSPFFRKQDYMVGDPRFEKIKWSEREVVFAFARKEFSNLEICEKSGVPAPKPIFLQNNVLVLGFLGEQDLPYPTLVQTVAEERFLDDILESVRKLYKAGLVHGDLSEYNVMIGNDGTAYLIDWGQGVVLAHPKAEEFLERDVRNVLNFFRKFGFAGENEKTMEWIRSE